MSAVVTPLTPPPSGFPAFLRLFFLIYLGFTAPLWTHLSLTEERCGGPAQ